MPLHCYILGVPYISNVITSASPLFSSFYVLSGIQCLGFYRKMTKNRSLRKGTRKDYIKMAAGETVSGLESEGERSDNDPCKSDDNNTDGGENNNNMDGEILNKEIFLDEDSGGSSNGGSSSDDEISVAEKKLLALKKEQKKLLKKKRLQHIAEEKELVRKSLEKLRKGKKDEAKKVTVKSLRSMQDVVSKVDKLMDQNLKLGKRVSSSESSSSSSSDSDSSDSDSSSNSGKRKEKGKRKERRSKKGGKHKSGKSKRLTSYVRFPQKWPHSHLSLHFVNREKKYEDLSLAEFCAGYATILEMTSESKRDHRTAHFKELMYLSTKYQWKCVLNYHAACLLEIERGHMRWGDNFQVLQNTTLAGGFLSGNRSGAGSSSGSGRFSGGASSSNASSSNASSSNGPNPPREEGVIFCKGYQRQNCKYSRDHYGNFYGENRLLKHICAKCWQKTRSIETHPENSEKCPLKDEL